MKKIYTTLVLLFAMGFMNAQVVSIPDINFKLKLLSASPTNQIAKNLAGNWTVIDTNGDNLIQQSEANNISYLDINESINENMSIQGYLNFTNLRKLIIKGVKMSSVNISSLTTLEEFKYEAINYFTFSLLNNFDVSGCVNLKKVVIVDVYDNINTYSNSNLIFNFSNLQNLEEVFLFYRTVSPLNSNAFVFTNCNNLKKIRFDYLHSGNFNLNLQNLASLEEFIFNGEASISLLNFNGSSNLKLVNINSYYDTTLNSLVFDGLNELTDFSYNGYANSNLSSISFQNCIKLKNLRIYSERNNAIIPNLNLTNVPLLESLEIGAFSLTTNMVYISNFNLQNLDVSNCVLLKNLRLYNTLVSNLDLSNNHLLETLQCQNNQLTSLDLSSCGNLQSVNCNNNNLEYVSFKNNTNETKTFLNNPNLTYICADDAEQWDVQLIVNLYEMWDTCNVGDYCSFVPNGNFNTLTGTATYDNENDGCDINDEDFEFLRLNFTDGTNSGSTFTNFEGDYTFYMNEGNFTLIPQLENPTYFNVSPATANFSFTDNLNNTASQNFCITPNGIHNDVEVVLAQVTPARPGFDAEYSLVYKNKGNQTEDAYIVINFDDTILDFVSTSLSPTNSIPGTIHWLVPSLLPFENGVITIVFHVNAPTDTPSVNIGDILHFYTTIDIVSADEHPADNGFNFNQTVVGSYDPNDIYCLEGDVVDPTLIGQYLHYNVRFENTGTAAAENIVVATTINPAEYDLNTLQVLNASHNVYTRIKNNKVEFIFENIQLAGSPSGGHGNILFKMKSKNNLQTNDDVTSNANIFFDYNFPVETNDATTVFETLSNQDFTKDTSVKVFPNPAKETVTISAKNIINSITIYDAQGRIVQFIKANELEKTIDVSILSNGIYILDIVSEKGRMVEKLVKK